VIFNGVQSVVPGNFRGDLQKDRERFFGVINIPVPFDALQENNEISITFPNYLGNISTVTMPVWNFSKGLPRSSGPVTGVRLAEDRVESFDLSVYPNPTNGGLVIDAPEKVAAVQVYDVRGRRWDVRLENGALDISRLPSGVFILRTEFNNGTIAQTKFTKMK